MNKNQRIFFNNKLVIRTSILLLLLSFSNCSTSSAGITTSNVPIGNKKYKVLSPVEDYTAWVSLDIGIIGFPVSKPPVNRLMKESVQKKSADALINIHYWNDSIVLFLITIHRFGFHAEAIKFEEENANEVKKSR